MDLLRQFYIQDTFAKEAHNIDKFTTPSGEAIQQDLSKCQRRGQQDAPNAPTITHVLSSYDACDGHVPGESTIASAEEDGNLKASCVVAFRSFRLDTWLGEEVQDMSPSSPPPTQSN